VVDHYSVFAVGGLDQCIVGQRRAKDGKLSVDWSSGISTILEHRLSYSAYTTTDWSTVSA